MKDFDFISVYFLFNLYCFSFPLAQGFRPAPANAERAIALR